MPWQYWYWSGLIAWNIGFHATVWVTRNRRAKLLREVNSK